MKQQTPILFLHGVGLGLLPYLLVIHGGCVLFIKPKSMPSKRFLGQAAITFQVLILTSKQRDV